MILEVVLLFVTVVLYGYYAILKQSDFFKNAGIRFRPNSPFKQILYFINLVRGKEVVYGTFAQMEKEFSNDKIVGYFLFGKPIFLIFDLDVAKEVLVKSFDHFTDLPSVKTEDEIQKKFLLNLKGDDWKQMRSLMSRVFTSGKLKLMYPHIANIGVNFEAHIQQASEKAEQLEMKDVGSMMTLDAIATSVFGIEVNSFEEPENTFRTQAAKLMDVSVGRILIIVLFPFIRKFVDISLLDAKALKFFTKIIQSTYEERQQSGVRRNDLIDLIIEEMKNPDTTGEDGEITEFERDAELMLKNVENVGQTESGIKDVLIANALLFFFAGFETTSAGFSICCHFLAKYQNEQDKLVSEIDEVTGGDDSELTYSQLQELKMMDLFIQECLRCQPLSPLIERECTKDFKLPGTEIVVPKGYKVQVYTRRMELNPENFTFPFQFEPENFSPENCPTKFASMAFGQGPRNCIGMRYAMLTLKTMLVSVLRRHRMVKGDQFEEVLRYSQKKIGQVEPVYVKFHRRT